MPSNKDGCSRRAVGVEHWEGEREGGREREREKERERERRREKERNTKYKGGREPLIRKGKTEMRLICP